MRKDHHRIEKHGLYQGRGLQVDLHRVRQGNAEDRPHRFGMKRKGVGLFSSRLPIRNKRSQDARGAARGVPRESGEYIIKEEVRESQRPTPRGSGEESSPLKQPPKPWPLSPKQSRRLRFWAVLHRTWFEGAAVWNWFQQERR